MLQPRNIATCGLFARLSSEDAAIVDSKDKVAEREDPKFMARIATFILLHESPDEKQKDVYVRLSDLGRLTLAAVAASVSGVSCVSSSTKIISTTPLPVLDKKMRAIFNVRTMFEDQERQKVLKKCE